MMKITLPEIRNRLAEIFLQQEKVNGELFDVSIENLVEQIHKTIHRNKSAFTIDLVDHSVLLTTNLFAETKLKVDPLADRAPMSNKGSFLYSPAKEVFLSNDWKKYFMIEDISGNTPTELNHDSLQTAETLRVHFKDALSSVELLDLLEEYHTVLVVKKS